MSFERLLVHTATLQRRAAGVDRFGQPNGVWSTYATVRCRLTNPRGGVMFTDRSRDVVKADHTIYFEADVSIGEQSRIGEVKDATGTVLATNLVPLLRRPVSTRDGKTHHISVPCQLYREASVA